MGNDATMVFEQPAELNRYILPRRGAGTLPRFWQKVRQSGGTAFSVYLILMVRPWSKGLPLLPTLACALPIVAAMLLFAWYGCWKEDRSKRMLSICDDGLNLNLTPEPRIRWNRIQCVRVEPCGPQGEFEKVTVRYASVEGTQSFSWSMIFADTASGAALLSEMEKRQAGDDRKFTIEILKAPVNPRNQFPVALHCLYLFSTMCLLLGMLILFVGFSSVDKLNLAIPEGLSQPVRVLVKWFARGADPSTLYIPIGAALTAAGACGRWFASAAFRRQRKIDEAEEAEDFKRMVTTGDMIEVK